MNSIWFVSTAKNIYEKNVMNRVQTPKQNTESKLGGDLTSFPSLLHFIRKTTGKKIC